MTTYRLLDVAVFPEEEAHILLEVFLTQGVVVLVPHDLLVQAARGLWGRFGDVHGAHAALGGERGR